MIEIVSQVEDVERVIEREEKGRESEVKRVYYMKSHNVE